MSDVLVNVLQRKAGNYEVDCVGSVNQVTTNG